MYLAYRWQDRNLTRIELIMALLIFILLIGFFSRHMLLIFSQAERSMVDRTINSINTALNYRVSLAIMRNQSDKFEELIRMNPMEDMRTNIAIEDFNADINLVFANEVIDASINYGGTILSDDLILDEGKWYFNKTNSNLIYILNNTEFFESSLEGQARIIFRIQVDYQDSNNNGQFDYKIDKLDGIKLRPTNQYSWN